MKKNKILLTISNFLTIYLFLKLLVLSDGNISLRYFTDDLARILPKNYLQFFTIDILIISLSLLIVTLKFYFQLKKTSLDLFSHYLLYISTFVPFLYFLRIFDLERLYLIIFFAIIPYIDFYFFQNNNLNIKFKIFSFIFLVTISLFLIFQPSSLPTAEIESNSLNINNIFQDNPVKFISKYDISNKYLIEKFSICCTDFTFYEMAGKSTGYLKVINDDLLHVSGFGTFSVYSIPKFLNKEAQVPKFINSNLNEIIKNQYIFDLKNWESVKDVLINDDKIYLSYIEEPKADCVNVQILVADYNNLFLNFKKFFTYPECVFRNISPYNAHQAGGKLTELDDKYILLSTGDFRKYELPQDLNSYFGKILKINKENSGDVNIVSFGHRNIQGLTTTKIENIFISTEHGPLGGDEINLINVNLQENFGWPISSYGTHYDGTFKEEAPLYKSHQNFGFKEPIWYFSINQNDVHGISDVILNHFSEEDSFFIGSLKANLLYEINVDLDTSIVTSITSFKVGERIRDIEFYKEQNLYFLLLEESPAIAILKIKDSFLPTLPVDYYVDK